MHCEVDLKKRFSVQGTYTLQRDKSDIVQALWKEMVPDHAVQQHESLYNSSGGSGNGGIGGTEGIGGDGLGLALPNPNNNNNNNSGSGTGSGNMGLKPMPPP